MKKILAIVMVAGGLTSAFGIDCANTPVGMELAKTIEAKDVAKAKTLLKAYRADVEDYLDNCDKSKEKFEETSVTILTYEDRLSDVEADLKAKPAENVDCSKVPSEKAIQEAFKSADATKIKTQYAAYKTASENYLEYCTAHEEYEFVFEASLLHEEAYIKWEKSAK